MSFNIIYLHKPNTRLRAAVMNDPKAVNDYKRQGYVEITAKQWDIVGELIKKKEEKS